MNTNFFAVFVSQLIINTAIVVGYDTQNDFIKKIPSCLSLIALIIFLGVFLRLRGLV